MYTDIPSQTPYLLYGAAPTSRRPPDPVLATQLHIRIVLVEGAFPVLADDLQRRTVPPHLHPRFRTHAIVVASPHQRIPRFPFGSFYSEVTIN